MKSEKGLAECNSTGLYRRVSILFFCATLIVSCKKSDQMPEWHWDGSLHISDPKAVAKTNSQKIYAHYMPWFDTPETTPEGNWGLHWTMENRNPDIMLSGGKREIASFFYPLIGPYASSDPDLIDYHSLLMKYTGIDGVIVDWYGSHEIHDYPLTRRNTDSLFNRLPRSGLTFSICYEDITLDRVQQATGMEPVPAAQQDFNFLQSQYFSSSSYVKINGRPLVHCFGPRVMQTEEEWKQTFSGLASKPLLLTLWNLGELPGSQSGGEYTWVYIDNIDCQYFYEFRAPTLANAFGSAFPGFKDFYDEGGWSGSSFVREHNGTSTLKSTLSLAKSSRLDNIQLITWNDFGEGTMIEPTLEFGYSFLQTVQLYTGVSYTKAELELIYKWYTLRKKYPDDEAVQTRLLQAYYYLASLDVAKARMLIESVE